MVHLSTENCLKDGIVKIIFYSAIGWWIWETMLNGFETKVEHYFSDFHLSCWMVAQKCKIVISGRKQRANHRVFGGNFGLLNGENILSESVTAPGLGRKQVWCWDRDSWEVEKRLAENLYIRNFRHGFSANAHVWNRGLIWAIFSRFPITVPLFDPCEDCSLTSPCRSCLKISSLAGYSWRLHNKNPLVLNPQLACHTPYIPRSTIHLKCTF